MSQVSYKVTSDSDTKAIRFTNYESFISHVTGEKKSRLGIVTLIYNNPKNARLMIDYLSREQRKEEVDLIVIDNSTKPEFSEELVEICNAASCNVIYVKPHNDMGSAGGYSLGAEWAIGKGYDYITIWEDDVILVDQGIFDMCLERIEQQQDEKHIYYIRDCNGNIDINTSSNGHPHSWYVLFGCYPRSFLEKVGVIDPRYFFRGEDIEWGKRIRQGMHSEGYRYQILPKNFYHPYMKSGNGGVYWIYFSIRNQLFTYEKWRENAVQLLFTIILYMQNALLNLCVGKGGIALSVWLALKDSGKLTTITLHESEAREHQLRKYKSFRPKHMHPTKVPTPHVSNLIQNTFMIIPRYQFDRIDLTYIYKHRTHGYNRLLIGGIGGPLNPLFLCFPNIISIEETYYLERMTMISLIQNRLFWLFILLNIICVIPAILWGVISWVVILLMNRKKKVLST